MITRSLPAELSEPRAKDLRPLDHITLFDLPLHDFSVHGALEFGREVLLNIVPAAVSITRRDGRLVGVPE